MSAKAKEICARVRRLLRYKADPKGVDVWQSPAVTEKLRTGDCEDFAILVLARCRKAKIKCRLVLGFSPKGGHAVCAGDGWYSSNAHYATTRNLADSIRRDCGWPSIKTIEVNDTVLRRKGVRL